MSFWSDPYIVSLSVEERDAFLYLITNERTSACGIYETTLNRMCADLKYSQAELKSILNKFEKDQKIAYSRKTGEIAMLNWRKYNGNKSWKFQKRVTSELSAVKDRDLVDMMVNGVGEPVPMEEPGEESQEETNDAIPLINKSFNEFWNLYDRKTGDRVRAERLWNKLNDQERDAIMDHVPLFKVAQPDKHFRPHPATYLNQRRWENEIVSSNGVQPQQQTSKFSNEW
jgi:hypothetical protein